MARQSYHDSRPLNATKQRAGSLGGQATFEKYGKNYMACIGRRGAETTWRRYHLEPVGVSGWALIDRETGKVKSVWG